MVIIPNFSSKESYTATIQKSNWISEMVEAMAADPSGQDSAVEQLIVMLAK